jgi:selT/selW/selH-like putative selenoprotein
LAASLTSRFGEKVQIKPGKTGQFDVVVDGKVIFSKGEVGRFPLANEVEESFAKVHG